MYELLDLLAPNGPKKLGESTALIDLWNQLDGFTAQKREVVITKNGEVVAGNALAIRFAGTTIKTKS